MFALSRFRFNKISYIAVAFAFFATQLTMVLGASGVAYAAEDASTTSEQTAPANESTTVPPPPPDNIPATSTVVTTNTGSTNNTLVDNTVVQNTQVNNQEVNELDVPEDIPKNITGLENRNENTLNASVAQSIVVQEVVALEDSESVTLCHATGSETNPWVKITVSAAGAYNGHYGAPHQAGEDIIPEFVYQGQTYSQNWDTEGQAIFNANCPSVILEEEDNVTLCHATGSTTNPFQKITISPAGAFNGHYGSEHQNGEDIIPPFEFDGQTYSQNWDAAGQAIYNNNCVPRVIVLDADVTLCHATGSTTNPFVEITVSAAGAFNGHLGNTHQNGEDIIPPFTFNGQTYSQNWDAEGQAIFNNDCEVGGRGGNPVVPTITTVPVVFAAAPVGGMGASLTPGELVNTGNSLFGSSFAALAIIFLTMSLALPVRKYKF